MKRTPVQTRAGVLLYPGGMDYEKPEDAATEEAYGEVEYVKPFGGLDGYDFEYFNYDKFCADPHPHGPHFWESPPSPKPELPEGVTPLCGQWHDYEVPHSCPGVD